MSVHDRIYIKLPRKMAMHHGEPFMLPATKSSPQLTNLVTQYFQVDIRGSDVLIYICNPQQYNRFYWDRRKTLPRACCLNTQRGHYCTATTGGRLLYGS